MLSSSSGIFVNEADADKSKGAEKMSKRDTKAFDELMFLAQLSHFWKFLDTILLKSAIKFMRAYQIEREVLCMDMIRNVRHTWANKDFKAVLSKVICAKFETAN